MPLIRLSVLALATLLIPTKAAPTAPEASSPGGDWKLVWSDEFDHPGAPDPAKWDYEEGFIRNGEAQYYARDRRENARVENGMLVIEARRERWDNPRYDPKARPGRRGGSPTTRPAAEYTSASLTTFGRAEWTYGRIEVRGKLPRGRGVWPAVWMLGVNRPRVGWPACGEIDVMEFVGHTPDTVHGTAHFRGREGRHRQSGDRLAGVQPSDDFHVYAVEWTPERMDFFFDGRRYHTFHVAEADDAKGDNAFRHPFHLILNFAVGGTWGGAVDPSVFPQQYLVDYVRIYQKAEGASGSSK